MTSKVGNIVVCLNGWPGVGKLSIARELTELLAGRLMDNHTLLNPAAALFDRRDPNWLALRKEIRAIVFTYMARIEVPAALVLTDALVDHDWDRGLFEDCRQLADARSARFVLVMIECDAEENARRLQSPDRAANHKLVQPELLAHFRSRYELLRPDGVECIDVNVTSLPAEVAARQIEAKLLALHKSDISG